MTTQFSLSHRRSGILLHPTSLPSPYGIGDLGPEAYRFAQQLKKAGQTWWQTFPLGPTGYGNSPYQTLSVFAGNPLLISIDRLIKENLLTKSDVRSPFQFPQGHAEYEKAKKFKQFLFIVAFDRFQREASAHQKNDFADFCIQNKAWLNDFSMFAALRYESHEAPWWEWDPPLKRRDPNALNKIKTKLDRKIELQKFIQFKFFQQWNDLKKFCGSLGIGFMGDVPIFVALDSADVWTHPHLFHLDRHQRPTIVAGVPPDYFSKTGQRWGNPLYRWEVHEKDGFRWWIDRFRMAFHMFDAVRLDHFIGFTRYWAIPAREKTAVKGHWMPGPGTLFFEKTIRALGHQNFIAEDLGQVTDQVLQLRDKFGFPGMRILQFAFGNNEEAKYHRPESYPRNCLVYPGTHDNDTLMGWFKDKGSRSSTRNSQQIRKEIAFALNYLKSNGRQIHWDIIRTAMASTANIAIVLAQDLLGKGSEARMNRPGISRGNWEWRLKPKEFTQKISTHLKYLTKISHRFPSSSHPKN